MQKVFSRLVQTCALAIAVLLGASSVYAQSVAVSMADISGRPGETAMVGVNISGVEAASAINSFGFTVTTGAGITFTGIESAGTLSGTAGFTTSVNTTTGAVGGFAQGTSVSTSGNLIFLKFSFASTGAGAITLTSFQLNNGTPTATAAPASSYSISNRLMAISDHSGKLDTGFMASVSFLDALVAGDNANAFSVDVKYDATKLKVNKTQGSQGVVKTGTMTAGWTVNGNDVGGANSGTYRVAGFGAKITGLGTLFKLAFTPLAAGTSTLSISNVSIQSGNPTFAFRNGTVVIIINTKPTADAGTMTVAEDGSGTFTMTGADADGDPITFSVSGNPTHGAVSTAGAVVTYTPAADYNGADSFTYKANDGSEDSALATVAITVTAVNDAPVFTASATDQTMTQDAAPFNFTYIATDVDGDALTYSLTAVAGASIGASSGAFSFDPSAHGHASTHTIAVSVSDGTATVAAPTASFTVTEVNNLGSALAGVHENPVVITPGSGAVSIRLDAPNNTMTVTGSFAALSGEYWSSHIHMAAVGMNGGVVVPLTAVASADKRSGSWSAADNTYDLSTLNLPTGTSLSDFIAALRGGNTYVNVHSAASGPGEIRGQVLSSTNTAPAGAVLRAPGSVVITGSPDAPLYSVSWLPVADAEGNKVNYLFEMGTDPTFSDIIQFDNLMAKTGFEVSVERAARLFDMVTGAGPGNVNVGGSAKVYMRTISSDGSLWTAGPVSELTLTRGVVTDTEGENELPTEFALKGNYPNPFNPSTTIQFDLPQTAEVNVVVLDLLGRIVLDVPSQTVEAGASRSLQLNASSLASGIYLYRVIARMQNDTRVKVGTMTLLK